MPMSYCVMHDVKFSFERSAQSGRHGHMSHPLHPPSHVRRRLVCMTHSSHSHLALLVHAEEEETIGASGDRRTSMLPTESS